MKFRFTRKATGVAPRRAAHRGTGRGRVPLTSARRWRAVGWRQGRITKAGNGAARRMLIEAAWSYRLPARIRRELLLRQEGLARSIRDTAWKAQERLCRRYRKLARAGKPPTVVTTAIARELAGFVWAIAYQVTVCVKFCKGFGLGCLAELGFFVLFEIVHVEVAVCFEPVLVGFDGEARMRRQHEAAWGKIWTT